MAGFMPLQRQCGFIYGSPDLNIVAHELGHGAFNLYHTFSPKNYIAKEQTTDNLMDYKGGTELWKFQWEQVQDPQRVWLSWAQSEEEGEAIFNNFTWLNGENGVFASGELEGKVEALTSIINPVNDNIGDYIIRFSTADKSPLTTNSLSWSATANETSSIIEDIRSKNISTFKDYKSKNLYGWYETSVPTGRFTSIAVYVFKDNVTLGDSTFHSVGEFASNKYIKVGYYDGIGIDLKSRKYGVVAFFDAIGELLVLLQIDDTNEDIESSISSWRDYLFTSSIDVNNNDIEEYEDVMLNDVQWISQFDNSFSSCSCYADDACCFVASNQILSYSGVSTNRSQQIVIAQSSSSTCDILTATDLFKEGVELINISLDEHKLPIVVGVHHPKKNQTTQAWYHYCSGNKPSITNHYVVIVGKGYDETTKKNYFIFYEVGTSHSSNGKSADNKLYIEDGNLIIGNTKYVSRNGYYTVTEVRKNIEKTYNLTNKN
ncbi:MAG: hypothetical protein QM786_06795 [Breznakibacter sp.]